MGKIVRKESFNHRTTPLIEWIVYFNGFIVATCKTKKEAKIWLDIYTA